MCRIFVFIFLFLYLFAGFAYSQQTCDLCRESISGKYWQVGSKNYCDGCYNRTRLRCSSCGVTIDGRYYKDGGAGNYCSSCAKEKFGKKCFMCKQNITGKYFEKNGQNICESCYSAHIALKCDRCSNVISGRYAKNGAKNYCQKCYEQYYIPRCCVCEKSIKGEGLGVSGSPYVFCRQCYDRYEHCRSCGIPVKDQYNSERNFPLCSTCSTGTVVAYNELKNIFQRVKQSAYRAVGLELKFDEKRLFLVNSQRLLKLTESIKSSVNEPLGVCQPEYVFGFLIRQTIYIQNGMPAEMVFDTLSHEYAHAWRNANAKPEPELSFEEGFCEWVAYKNLLDAGFKERALRKLENKDPVYGGGLRKMLDLEKRLGGTDAVLRYVKNNKSF